MERYFLSSYNFKGLYTIEKILSYLLPPRKLPYNLHPYGKSMFWMLSPLAAMYVVERVENDARLMRFFSLCWASDEFVFQTILLNSHFKDKVVNENYRYIDWSLGGPSPKTLDADDFATIAKSDMLFARKISSDKSTKLLDLIDSVAMMCFLIPVSDLTWPILST